MSGFLARIGLLALMISSLWLLAIDSTGRILRSLGHPVISDIARGDSATAPDWLTAWAMADPHFALLAGKRCVVTAASPQDCRRYFEQAIAGNPRLSEAALALAQLAEERGEKALAIAIHQNLRRQDHSFAVLWSEWNLHLRLGNTNRFRELTGEILSLAPARFRGDFPLLAFSGWDQRAIVAAMVRSGSASRALDYTIYLGANQHTAADSLLVDLLRHFAPARAHTVAREGRTTALRFVAQRLRAREGVGGAAAVWQAAVDHGYLADRRLHPTDDIMLNPNPGLQTPFVPQSFDWSVADNQHARAIPSTRDRGIRLLIKPGAPDGIPLLSKLVALPGPMASVRVRAAYRAIDWQYRKAAWQVSDAASGKVLASAEMPPGEWLGPFSVIELPLPPGPLPEAVFLTMVYRTGIKRTELDRAGVARQSPDFEIVLDEVWLELIPPG